MVGWGESMPLCLACTGWQGTASKAMAVPTRPRKTSTSMTTTETMKRIDD
jgi:hypothetical protein